jgi:hypothetical protein
VVEIQSWQRVAVHRSVADTVDALLRGYDARPETRQLSESGRIEIVDGAERVADSSFPAAPAARQSSRQGWEIGHHRRGGHVREGTAGEAAPATPEEVSEAIAPPLPAVKLFPFGVSRSRLEQAQRTTGVTVELVDDVREADALVTLRSYYRSKPVPIREAEERSLPIYVVKSNTAYQLEQVLMQFRDNGDGRPGGPRRDPMVEVYRETEDAIARVMQEGRPIELAPANSYVRRIQHQIATRYNLDSRSAGKEPQRRVKILPFGH